MPDANERRQGIIRISKAEFYDVLANYCYNNPNINMYAVVTGVVQNPYNNSVDLIVENSILEPVAEFEAPPILNLGGKAGPKDFTMRDST